MLVRDCALATPKPYENRLAMDLLISAEMIV